MMRTWRQKGTMRRCGVGAGRIDFGPARLGAAIAAVVAAGAWHRVTTSACERESNAVGHQASPRTWRVLCSSAPASVVRTPRTGWPVGVDAMLRTAPNVARVAALMWNGCSLGLRRSLPSTGEAANTVNRPQPTDEVTEAEACKDAAGGEAQTVDDSARRRVRGGR